MATVPCDKHSSVNGLNDVLKSRKITGAALTPDLLHQIVTDPTCLESIRRLEVIVFGSGSLSATCAHRIMKDNGPVIQNFYGCTESWPSIQRPGLADDPRFLSFHPYGGYELQHRSADLFELIVNRFKGLEDYQPVFWSFPEMSQFATGDLFSQHPRHPGYWRHRGSLDDMINIAPCGVKLFVANLERAIEQHEWVRSALIGNDSCRAPVVMLEPTPQVLTTHAVSSESFIDCVWPALEAANRLCTENARMQKDLVFVAKERFVRTAKGSVARRSTMKLLKREMEKVYTA
ncbi:hypothetical protein MMC17_009199 [Xylographa soralifera]|nr:hypothetical protein [Xylographa soralifera]